MKPQESKLSLNDKADNPDQQPNKDLVATDLQKLSKGANYFEKMRLELQSNKVLENAWLLYQEITIK